MSPASVADLDLLFHALTARLRARQDSLQQALGEADRDDLRTSEDLERLYSQACAAVDDAVSLLTFLLERGGTDDQLEAAENLVEFYQVARKRLEREQKTALG